MLFYFLSFSLFLSFSIPAVSNNSRLQRDMQFQWGVCSLEGIFILHCIIVDNCSEINWLFSWTLKQPMRAKSGILMGSPDNNWDSASLTSLRCLSSVCSKVPNCNSVGRSHKYSWAKPRPILSRRPTHARRHRQDRRDPRPGRSAQWIMNDIYSVFVESNSINLFTIPIEYHIWSDVCVSDGQADKLISLWLKHIWLWLVLCGAGWGPAQPGHRHRYTVHRQYHTY